MRDAFSKILVELAEKDKNIYLLTADLGFGVFDEFVKKFPDRFFNCGIAEQGMMGIAAGLALSGKKVYAYSMIPFVAFRCFEQLRNDVCYQNLDVKVIGIAAGFTFGQLGLTHQAVEDISVLRALVNLTILSPADPVETRELLLKSYHTKNPTFIRLSRKGEPVLYSNIPNFEIGKPSVLTEGKDGAIIATGICVAMALKAVNELKKRGYYYELISLHTLKPVNKEALYREIKDKKIIITAEEHYINGGLGSIVAEILAESDWRGIFKRIAIPEDYNFKDVGEGDYVRRKVGLEPDAIVKQILKLCNATKKARD